MFGRRFESAHLHEKKEFDHLIELLFLTFEMRQFCEMNYADFRRLFT